MTQPDSTEDTFTLWRRSYRALRSLETDLVRRARSGEDPVVIARMYDQVDVLRTRTSELFHLAQTASMTHQIPVARLTAMTLETTASEFGALYDE
ncbi:MAG: hypothetical protein NVS3B2_04800 [Ramlibacter sp.]